MTLFILFAAFLLLIVLAFLLPPLWRRHTPINSAQHKEANLRIFRDQLADLEREHQQGTLGTAEFEQAKLERQRRLLEEIPEELPAETGRLPGRKTAIGLALLLPAMAIAIYLLLGNPQALNPLAAVHQDKMTPEQIQNMVTGLAERLKTNPDDTQGWLMLARSYKNQGKNADAAAAYSKVESAIATDPDLLTEYADLLASTANGNLQGKPLALINQALHANPNHVVGLWLAGTAAYNSRDYADAVIFWERAVKNLAPDSDDAKMLKDSIADARQRSNTKVDHTKTISGELTLSPAMAKTAQPNDTVFIFARPVNGARIPLAINKIHVSDLPYHFVLDDSSAMMPDKRISAENEVIVEARISDTGNAIAKNGDLQSNPEPVKVGKQDLHLVIDRTITK